MKGIEVSPEDRAVLRGLAEGFAELSSLEVHRDRRNAWAAMNGLRKSKPMVLIFQIPWHELMQDDPSLRCCVAEPYLRTVEWYLRRSLYQWAHMPGDMVLPAYIPCEMDVKDTGFGMQAQGERGASMHYSQQIRTEEDLAGITTPIITHERESTEARYDALCGIFDGILPIRKVAAPTGLWFAPWDLLVSWWGVQEALLDLVLQPELVHMAMQRMLDAELARLHQYEGLGLLTLNNDDGYFCNNELFVGSGGYGFSDELPAAGGRPADAPIMSNDIWGCATAQIFSEVSPKMHEEFSLQYDRQWLSHFGLSYYGCCEPLHRKLGILSTIPNLRKVSMSPWVNVAEATEAMGGRYVYSHKPNPALIAGETWDVGHAEGELVRVLEQTRLRGCPTEVVLKDISTLRGEPHRLWEWAQMAARVTERYE